MEIFGAQRLSLVLAVLAIMAEGVAADQVTVAGVKITAPGPTKPIATLVAKYKLRLALPPGAGQATELSVDLPVSGPGWWPADEVVVRDRDGQLVPATHLGTEWNRFTFTARPEKAPYLIDRDRENYGQRPIRLAPDSARIATDSAAGIEVRVCGWYDDRAAAFCMRFDDSHPSHLSTVIPILNRHGFRGTFMVNPGNPGYLEHKAEWEEVARSGRHELADHTMHHRGAASDEEAEREIGDAARYLQSLLSPGRSKLIALNLGGGTKWTVTKPLRYFLAKFHCWVVTGSMGMDDAYGHRVEALRRHIEANIKRGGWCKVHWHYVGPGLSTSLENFRAEMAVVERYKKKLWICGLTDAYKYLTERRATGLKLTRAGDNRWTLEVSCGTDPALFDQPLTLAISAPAELIGALRLVGADGKELKMRRLQENDKTVLLVDVPPRSASYMLKGGGD